MRSFIRSAAALTLVLPRLAFADATPTPSPATSPRPIATAPTAVAANPVPAQALPRPSRLGETQVTPSGAIWRSAVIPGWGQRYKGERKKGWIFTGIAAGLVASTLGSYVYAQQAHSAYEGLGPGSDPSSFNGAYDREVQAAVLTDFLAGATAVFWGANVAESAFTPLEHLRIKDARVKDVFPAFNKYYETNPLVTVSVENRSGEPVSRVKVKFEAKEVMDLPAESETVEVVPPGLGRSFSVTVPFNKKIFEVGAGEPKELQGKITVDYEVGNKRQSMVRTATFTVYGRNAIVWDDMRKLSAFVTPRDDGVKTFVGAVTTKKLRVSSIKSISLAAEFFDALTAYGLTYVSDPSAPFSYFEGNAEAVDTVNYPFETLLRKTGDCDDLTSIYASLLESAGVSTGLVDVPGHVFVVFDSELTPEEMKSYLGSDSGYVEHNGTAWVPVEITALGKPFNEAWQLGATEVKKWSGLNQFHFVETVPSQAVFPPSPPAFQAVPASFSQLDGSQLVAFVNQDTSKLSHSEAAAQDKAIAEVKGRKLDPAAQENEIGILYAKSGRYEEAKSHFSQALQLNPKLAKVYNNLANLAYLQGDFAGATRQYEDALTQVGESPAILVNLANLSFEQGDAKKARSWFERAVRLEPAYARAYPEIAALLTSDSQALVKAEAAASGGGKGAAIGDRDPRKSRWIE